MDSLRARLEALLERELEQSSILMNSNTPLLNQDLDLFYIETPAKLSNSGPSSLTLPIPVSTDSIYQNPAGFIPATAPQLPKNTVRQQFPCIFPDPTPLRFISDSPLVTPLRFTH